MSRRGLALLAVLWTLTAVTVLTAAAFAGARLGSTTTRNRVLLARAAWAREACAEILQARWASPPYPPSPMRRGGATATLDSVPLPRRTWGSATPPDSTGQLQPNPSSRPALMSAFPSG